MIHNHDAEYGITWDSVRLHLDECEIKAPDGYELTCITIHKFYLPYLFSADNFGISEDEEKLFNNRTKGYIGFSVVNDNDTKFCSSNFISNKFGGCDCIDIRCFRPID